MLEFSTNGMNYIQRQKSFENGNIVPIGTVCYEAGDWLENTKKVVVDESNQKIISMLWNSKYFLNKEDADKMMLYSEREYWHWLQSYL